MSEVLKHQEAVAPKIEKKESPSEVKSGIEKGAKKISKRIGDSPKAQEKITKLVGKETSKEAGKKLADILHGNKKGKESSEKVSEKIKADIVDGILEDKYGDAYKKAIESGQSKKEIRKKYLESNKKILEINIKDKDGNEINKTKYEDILEKNINLSKLNTKDNKEFTKELLTVYGEKELIQYDGLIKEALDKGEKIPTTLEEFDKFIKEFSIKNPKGYKKQIDELVKNKQITPEEGNNRIKGISNAQAHNVEAQKLPSNFESLSGEEKTLELIKHFEGFVEKPYWDYKQWTHGYGTKAKGSGDIISKADATLELKTKVNSEFNLNNYLSKDIMNKLGDNQKSALTSFIFNLGPGKINNFKTLLENYPDTANQIAEKMERYNKAGGKILEGLVSRRKTESKLFLTENNKENKA